jgi:hypothetical protein
MAAPLAFAAIVQVNDPDPLRWFALSEVAGGKAVPEIESATVDASTMRRHIGT